MYEGRVDHTIPISTTAPAAPKVSVNGFVASNAAPPTPRIADTVRAPQGPAAIRCSTLPRAEAKNVEQSRIMVARQPREVNPGASTARMRRASRQTMLGGELGRSCCILQDAQSYQRTQNHDDKSKNGVKDPGTRSAKDGNKEPSLAAIDEKLTIPLSVSTPFMRA